MLVVNLDARPDAGAIAAALASDRLLVGLCRGALNPAAVAAADPEAAIAELRAAVARNPHAALVLGQVLRVSEPLSPAFAGRIVAALGTVFRLPEVSMGLIPSSGGWWTRSLARDSSPAARRAIRRRW